VFETGTNVWRRLPRWPLSCESGCDSTPQHLYLEPGFGLGFGAPARNAAPFDEYVSDPAKPVPYIPRPVHLQDAPAWQRWLVTDQRSVADRTDVLTYLSDVLTAPLHIGGAPVVNLFASTSGTDSDWVVKLIDVYPEEMPSDPPLGGYQLPVGMDIFRGRYRESWVHPSPIPPGKVERYRFALPHVNHVFLPAHRIMVQIQSSWFPLYDRNPQDLRSEHFLRQARRLPQGHGSGSFIPGARRVSSICRWSESAEGTARLALAEKFMPQNRSVPAVARDHNGA